MVWSVLAPPPPGIPRSRRYARSRPLTLKRRGRLAALRSEMLRAGLSFERECEMPVVYEREQVGTRRVDFFVEGLVLVELKAVSAMDDLHLVQLRNYLQVFGLEVGLLLNFGARSLEFKRLRNVV